MVLTFYFSFNTNKTEILIAQGKQVIIYLPDSSKITANADSKIVYNEKTWAENRTLTLSGEAFFEVKKGSRFTVVTNNGKVEVLGTSFNVYNRANNFEIACFTGKVKVSNQQNESKIITKGEAITLEDDKTLKKYNYNKETTAQWKTGNFYFGAKPLTDVFDELQRQYDIELELPDISDRVYTGSFNNEDLESALISICVPMNLSYTKQNNKYIISNNE